MAKEDGVFITGTDTGVGKTVVAAAIAYCLSAVGKSVAVMKPVQTGTVLSPTLDAQFVLRVLGREAPLEGVCPYTFEAPLSPFVAAQLVGEKIRVDRIFSAMDALRSSHDVLVVEGAGGLLVPITEGYFMADLARQMGLPLVVVSKPGLGMLNHTLLTLECARARGLEVAGIVVNNFPQSPGLAERTNPRALSLHTDIPIVGVIPHDVSISVEEGRVGRLRELAVVSLSGEYGGSFSFKEFLLGLERGS